LPSAKGAYAGRSPSVYNRIVFRQACARCPAESQTALPSCGSQESDDQDGTIAKIPDADLGGERAKDEQAGAALCHALFFLHLDLVARCAGDHDQGRKPLGSRDAANQFHDAAAGRATQNREVVGQDHGCEPSQVKAAGVIAESAPGMVAEKEHGRNLWRPDDRNGMQFICSLIL
jgi:hypothetical protein